jgi:hypothetical protein
VELEKANPDNRDTNVKTWDIRKSLGHQKRRERERKREREREREREE